MLQLALHFEDSLFSLEPYLNPQLELHIVVLFDSFHCTRFVLEGWVYQLQRMRVLYAFGISCKVPVRVIGESPFTLRFLLSKLSDEFEWLDLVAHFKL